MLGAVLILACSGPETGSDTPPDTDTKGPTADTADTALQVASLLTGRDIWVGATAEVIGGNSLYLTSGLVDQPGQQVVVGAPASWADYGDATRGAAYVLAGEGLQVRATALGHERFADFGQSIGVGDLTGDGQPDLVSRSSGRPRVFSGPLAGELAGETAFEITSDPYLPSLCGFARVTDSSGDGQADLICSLVTPEQTRALAVFEGPISTQFDQPPTRVWSTESAVEDFAGLTAAVADFDGDGVADLVTTASWYGPSQEGRAYLLLGPLDTGGSLSDADRRITGTRPRQQLGFRALEVGDQDGDGLPDLLLGSAIGDDGRGSAQVFTQIANGGDQPFGEVLGDDAHTWVAWSIASGDLDGSGPADIVLGSPGRDFGLPGDRGSVLGFHGGELEGVLTASDAPLQLIGEAPGDHAGTGVAVGDLDGDGHGDLLIGAAYSDLGAPDGGAVYLLPGPSLDW